MKTIRVIAGLLMLWLGTVDLTACAARIDEPQAPVVEVTERDTGATIDLEPGQPLRVKLAGNRTTGFQWLLIDLTGKILESVGEAPAYIESPNPSGLLGVGGIEQWTFRPQRQGSGLLRFEYRRPWENGREAIKSAVFNVRVK